MLSNNNPLRNVARAGGGRLTAGRGWTAEAALIAAEVRANDEARIAGPLKKAR